MRYNSKNIKVICYEYLDPVIYYKNYKIKVNKSDWFTYLMIDDNFIDDIIDNYININIVKFRKEKLIKII